jgi:D-proline reductase (dithiol) PrdB
MTEKSSNMEPSASKQEPLTLMAFVKSLWREERADNYFKFLKELPEQEVDHFFQGLLRTIGDAIDDRDINLLTHFVQQQQVHAYLPTQIPSPIRPNLPDAPFAPLRKPLREATIALFTSGAIHRDDQPPFYPAHMTYEEAMRNDRTAMERVASLRVIPADTPAERLRASHVAYDIRAAQKDINVMFPLTRFHELVQQGIIGAVAEKNYSFQGLTNIPRFRDETVVHWAQVLKDDQVDAVFLTPG